MDLKKSAPWFAAAIILVIIFGTIFAAVQQSERLGANYPQIQIAEDKAAALDNGADPAKLVAGKVNVSRSLAPFTIIYDKSGKVMAGSGYLNGSVPLAPLGVLRASSGHDYHFVTWQPNASTRIAAVSVSANKYYVLSGRSLKEVENNENRAFFMAFVGGILSMAVLLIAYSLARQR